MKRVEAFREQDGAAQHYYSGTPDGSRPGIYYAHLSDMNAMPKYQLEVIAYHEGLPGHHMQISIAQELTGVPKFRTQDGFSAYAEGWGLYSETLAKEMPAPTPIRIRISAGSSSEIWRAIRLVVDTGLHAKGWTEEQAIDVLRRQLGASRLEAIRPKCGATSSWPGQATSYKIGMIRIQELRDKAETELGDKFDIRGFHDTVLGGGALPLPVLNAACAAGSRRKQGQVRNNGRAECASSHLLDLLRSLPRAASRHRRCRRARRDAAESAKLTQRALNAEFEERELASMSPLTLTHWAARSSTTSSTILERRPEAARLAPGQTVEDMKAQFDPRRSTPTPGLS